MARIFKRTRILSIDVGITGALAWFEDGKCIEIFKMPTIEFIDYKKRKKKKLDFKELDRIFLNVSPEIVVIESVSAMPGNGNVSMFNFGMNYGALQAFAATYGDETILVRPRAWKAHFDLINTPKKAATELAKRFTPLVTNSGKADAYLIGRYYIEELCSK